MEEMNRECRYGRDEQGVQIWKRCTGSADMEEMNTECRYGRDEQGVQIWKR